MIQEAAIHRDCVLSRYQREIVQPSRKRARKCQSSATKNRKRWSKPSRGSSRSRTGKPNYWNWPSSKPSTPTKPAIPQNHPQRAQRNAKVKPNTPPRKKPHRNNHSLAPWLKPSPRARANDCNQHTTAASGLSRVSRASHRAIRRGCSHYFCASKMVQVWWGSVTEQSHRIFRLFRRMGRRRVNPKFGGRDFCLRTRLGGFYREKFCFHNVFVSFCVFGEDVCSS